MNLKLDVVRLINKDVIATSGIDHTKYLHYVVGAVDVFPDDTEDLCAYKYNKNTTKWDYSQDDDIRLEISGAEEGDWYYKDETGLHVCNEEHPLGD